MFRRGNEVASFFMSANAGGLEAPRDGALWVVQALGATLFLISGLGKLSGQDHVIQSLAAIGVHQGFRYVTALIEFGSAILFLIPALSGIGALLLVPIIIGAILAHLLVIGESPALPIGLLIITSVVAWGPKETALRLFGVADPKE
jgi:putative oxidoreductase